VNSGSNWLPFHPEYKCCCIDYLAKAVKAPRAKAGKTAGIPLPKDISRRLCVSGPAAPIIETRGFEYFNGKYVPLAKDQGRIAWGLLFKFFL
jgi:hypothetical protein